MDWVYLPGITAPAVLAPTGHWGYRLDMRIEICISFPWAEFSRSRLFFFFFFFWFVSFQSQCRVTVCLARTRGWLMSEWWAVLACGSYREQLNSVWFVRVSSTWNQELVLPKDDCNHLSDCGCIFKLYQPFRLLSGHFHISTWWWQLGTLFLWLFIFVTCLSLGSDSFQQGRHYSLKTTQIQ